MPNDELMELDERLAALEDDLGSQSSLDTRDLVQRQLSELPTTGVRNGARAWITDGRKTSEGAGSGTGVPAYFDEATSAWKRYSDDSNVAT